MRSMELTHKQRGVRNGAIPAIGITLSTLGAAIYFQPIHFTTSTSMGDRIAFAFRCDLLLALCLAASVIFVANHRFFTPEDIDGSGLTKGTPWARLLQARLQNTLEQTVLAVL